MTRAVALGALLAVVVAARGARADEKPLGPAPRNLVNAANAPISDVLQIRLLDSYAPEFEGARGRGNLFGLAVTMPLPEYRLLPLPQLSLLTIPAAVTTPSGVTGFGDLRFLDLAVFDAGHRVLWGVGPSFVFPTASDRTTGQGKWQAGAAAAVAFAPQRWLVGVLLQDLVSFAGDAQRKDASALFVQPFVSRQLGNGWFVRSQPQMIFDWTSGKQLLPISLGAGRVFTLGRQTMSLFVEPFWNLATAGPAPRYGITFGLSLLYPRIWHGG
jgi:hypothetical protein